jgi:hypothetical protein
MDMPSRRTYKILHTVSVTSQSWSLGIPPHLTHPSSMSHLPHCPSSLALCGDGAHHESLVSDGKFEAGLLSPPVSSAAVSAVHLHEATFPTQTQTLTSFVGEETAKDRTDLSSSQPLTTVRVLMIHIG